MIVLLKNKGLLITLCVASVLGGESRAEMSTAFGLIRDYGVPCAVSFGLGVALIKNDGASIGLLGCGVAASVTMINKHKESELDPSSAYSVDGKIKYAIDKNNEKIGKQFSQALKKASTESEKANEDTRRVIREVVADRLLSMDEDLNRKLTEKFEKADFMPALEKRINEKVKEETRAETRLLKRDVVKETTEEVLQRVTARPIEVPSKKQSLEELDLDAPISVTKRQSGKKKQAQE